MERVSYAKSEKKQKNTDKRKDTESTQSESNSALLKQLKNSARKRSDYVRNTTIRDFSPELTGAPEDVATEFSAKINMNDIDTAYIGYDAETDETVITVNPKGREMYHDDPIRHYRSTHTHMNSDLSLTRPHQTFNIKTEAVDKRLTTDMVRYSATDDKFDMESKGLIADKLSRLTALPDKDIAKTARALKDVADENQETELDHIADIAESAARRSEQMRLKTELHIRSRINAINQNNISRSDSYFDFLLRRRNDDEEEMYDIDEQEDDNYEDADKDRT